MKTLRYFLLVFFSCLLISLHSEAQEYKVYTMVGNPVLITEKGQFVLKKHDLLSPFSVINIPFNATLELFDETNRKQYILKKPGRGTIESMLKDNQNSIVSLTDRYFRFIVLQMQSRDANRTESDPASITRDEKVDSTNVPPNVPKQEVQ